MKSWLPIIFAVDKQITIGAGTFNHCSSLCPSNDGVIVAWYSGTGECQDDQSVYITYLSHNALSPSLRIGDKTGNPIVWREDNRHWILWSKFEDDGVITSPAHRWKYCSLWIQEIDPTPKLLGEPQKIANSTNHLLARTNPLVSPELTILPLYDEINRECVIYQGHQGEFSEISRFGGTHHIIQPTIWIENNTLHALSRNFGNGRRKSIYYYSDDYGHSWKYGGLSRFWNNNNSITISAFQNQHIVLWNNADSIYRKNMSIGIVEWKEATPCPHPLKILNDKYGSYPNICVDDFGMLHFTYTNAERRIEHHVWDRKTFNKYLKRSRYPARKTY